MSDNLDDLEWAVQKIVDDTGNGPFWYAHGPTAVAALAPQLRAGKRRAKWDELECTVLGVMEANIKNEQRIAELEEEVAHHAGTYECGSCCALLEGEPKG